MSFEDADKALKKLGENSQRHETEAMVEALKALSATITTAEHSLVVIGANSINDTIHNLKKTGDKTSEGIISLNREIKEFKGSLDELNSNLKSFDDKATKLANTANFLTWGLLVFAGIQAIAGVAQAFQVIGAIGN